ncbi:Abortive infection protein [Microbacterium testaceum]|nr:Abortive infection protein [Microbacterium testaceum]
MDWRLGGRAVARWDASLLAVVAASVGVGLIGAAVVGRIGAPWASLASTVTLWLGFTVAILFAIVRARPAGLLRFDPVDLLWGLCIGLGLRGLQGWWSGSASVSFPTAGALDGNLPGDWWLTVALPAGLLGPVIEEFLLRAVVLVALYQLLRPAVGALAAGLTGLLVSAGAFVLLHVAFGAMSLIDGVLLFTVGAVCSLTVLLTGRIWGAVLIHVVYNVSFLALVIVGTALK